MNLKDAREYIKKAYEQRFVDLYEESVLCKTHDKIIQAAILQCQLDTLLVDRLRGQVAIRDARIKQLEQERQEMISAFGEIVTTNIIDSNDLMQTAMMLKIPARRIIFKFNLEPFLQPPKEEGK